MDLDLGMGLDLGVGLDLGIDRTCQGTISFLL